MAAANRPPLKIGDWRVDPSIDEISRDGATVKLEPRAMRLLVLLADHAGEVVSMEQLLDTVWKDLVVTPDSIYQAVASLRRALRDDTKEPAYIANVLRRGYRLIAPVAPWLSPQPLGCGPGGATRSDPAAPRPAPTASVQMPSTAGRRRTLVWLLAIALLAGGYWVAHGWVREGGRGTSGSGMQTPGPTKAAVAVLPFLDLSAAKDQQYLADGLTEELIERLATAPHLHVAARSSSFYFKGRQATVAEIARTLGVSYLIEGSVRKSGQTLRITAHLVRAEDGYDLWSQTHERPLADILEVQDEIASGIVHQFKMSILTPGGLTSSPDAHEEYLRAEANINHGTANDYDAADTHLHTALKLDPGFAEAWAWLAMATVWRFGVREAGPPSEACARARNAATRALELKPTLAMAHRANGIVLRSCSRDFSGAEAEFNHALELQPGEPLVLMSQAELAMDMNRPDRAIELASHATALDPLNAWTFATLCDIHLNAGRAADAEADCRRAVQIDPSTGLIHGILAIALLTNHKPVDAVTEALRESDPQYRSMLLPIVLDAAGNKTEAEQKRQELAARYGEQNGDWVALYYACRNEPGPALRWLRTYAAGHQELAPYYPYLRACLANLEPDPRYEELMSRLRFAPRSD